MGLGKNMYVSIRQKLMLCFIATVLLIMFAIVFVVSEINNITTDMQGRMERSEEINEILFTLRELEKTTGEYLLTQNTKLITDFEIAISRLTEKVADNEILPQDDLSLRNVYAVLKQFLSISQATIDDLHMRNLKFYDVSKFSENISYTLDSIIYTTSRETSKSYIMSAEKVKTQMTINILILITATLGYFIVSFFLTRTLTKPIVSLAEHMRKISGEDIELKPVELKTHDEIRDMAMAFNSMVKSINTYITRIKEFSLEEKKLMEYENIVKSAQLKTLQAQINPHFLYNTLNAGSQLAILEGADATGSFLVSVSKLFRYNLSNLSLATILREEIEHVDLYYSILNTRYKGGITYNKRIMEECYDIVMPRMILQPLAENAALHGIGVLEELGAIEIEAYIRDEKLIITVADSGVGIPAEKIQKIVDNSIKRDKPCSGIGLNNIISRLQIFYGRDDVFEIQSEEGRYTKVILKLDVIRQKEESDV